jgi:hypothetical protein
VKVSPAVRTSFFTHGSGTVGPEKRRLARNHHHRQRHRQQRKTGSEAGFEVYHAYETRAAAAELLR